MEVIRSFTIMRLKFLFLISFWLISHPVFSQYEVEKGMAELQVGKSYEAIEAMTKEYFAFDEQLLAVKKDDQAIHLQCFDRASLKQKVHNKTELKNKKMAHEGTVKIGGELYFFYAWKDEEKGAEQLFYRKVDRENCTLGPSEKVFSYSEHNIEPRTKTGAGFLSRKGVDKFHFQSTSSSIPKKDQKLMVRFNVSADEHDEADGKEKVGFLVFDSSMELLWEDVHLMPHPEYPVGLKREGLRRWDYCVDKTGTVFTFSQVHKEGHDPHFKVFRFDRNGASFDHARLDLEDGMGLMNMPVILKDQKEGGALLTGFYGVGRLKNKAKGSFHWPIDPNGGSGEMKKHRFSKEFLGLYGTDGDRRRLERRIEKEGLDHERIGINGLVAREVIRFDDGGVILVGEAGKLERSNQQNAPDPTFKELIIVRMTPNGSVKWTKKLPKRMDAQREDRPGEDKVPYGFRTSPSSEALNIFFFDIKENLELSSKEYPSTYYSNRMDSWLTAYHLDQEKGEAIKTPVFDTEDLKGAELEGYGVDGFRMGRYVRSGSGNCVMEVTNDDGKDLLVRVEL